MPSTTELIRYRVSADNRPDFERAVGGLAQDERCAAYELTRGVDDPDLFVLRVEWTSPGEPPFADAVRERRAYVATAAAPTLYEWLGGTEALERLTTVFYEHVLRDELIGPLFAHMDPHHPRYVAMWLAEVFGGPSRYSQERGGYHHMLGRHLGKAITEPQRRRWVSLLMDAADEAALPTDPEFRAAFASYLEWGTRLAVANSQPDAHPAQEAPMPHWGWGVAPPYQAPRRHPAP